MFILSDSGPNYTGTTPIYASVYISEKVAIHKLYVKMLETSFEHMKNQIIIHVNQLGVGLRIYLEFSISNGIWGLGLGCIVV